MSIITIGIDLAKNIFAVHGVNENGQAEWSNPKLAAISYYCCCPCEWCTRSTHTL